MDDEYTSSRGKIVPPNAQIEEMALERLLQY
jgi:hypothetical protein